jgi:conjugal transfer pilus assembly protein TraF
MIYAIALLLLARTDPAFFDDHARGWFWYEVLPESQPEPEPATTPDGPASVVAQPPPVVLSPREQLTAQGEAWQDAMAAAVLEPTAENVRRYLELTRRLTAQAQRFASEFQAAIWTSPELDYTLESPVTTQAIIATNQAGAQADAQALRRLAEQAGLVFVFRGDCPVCHRFAPIIARFSETFGIHVLPVSLDGAALPQYRSPRRNNHFAGRVQVKTVPALYLARPDSAEVTPVGFGFTDWTTLQQKVLHAAVRIGLIEASSDAAAIGGHRE